MKRMHHKDRSYETGPMKEINRGRRSSVYGVLVCGIILVLIGAYMVISQMTTSGYAKPRFGPGGNVRMTGPGTIVLGAIILIYPVYELLFGKGKQKNGRNR